jgi:hypothetical protein
MIVATVSSDTFASAEGITMHTASPVLALCRKLVEAGYASSMPLEAFRDGALALRIRAIGEAATLTADGGAFRRAAGPGLGPPLSSIQPSTMAA